MSELNRILRNGCCLFLRVRLFLRRLQPVAKPIRMCTEIVYRLARSGERSCCRAEHDLGNLNTYYATYGTFSDPAPTNTFVGYTTLTDKDGFVAGLPFECTGPCANVIYGPDNGVEEFDWLNSGLDATAMTRTPEASSLVLLGVGIVGFTVLYLGHAAKHSQPKSSLTGKDRQVLRSSPSQLTMFDRHCIPRALEDCGHRISGHVFNNRLREPAE